MKKCGTDFMHQEWGITSGQSIKVRCNIPKDKLTILDRQYKDNNFLLQWMHRVFGKKHVQNENGKV